MYYHMCVTTMYVKLSALPNYCIIFKWEKYIDMKKDYRVIFFTSFAACDSRRR